MFESTSTVNALQTTLPQQTTHSTDCSATPAFADFVCSVLGSRRVGKSNFVASSSNLPPSFADTDNQALPRVVDTVRRPLWVPFSPHPRQIVLDILDTDASEEADIYRLFEMQETSIFIVLFSKANRHTLEDVKKRWKNIIDSILKQRKKGSKRHCVTVLVGATSAVDEDVETKEGWAMAKELGFETYLECDTSDPNSVRTVLEWAATAAIQKTGWQTILKQRRRIEQMQKSDEHFLEGKQSHCIIM